MSLETAYQAKIASDIANDELCRFVHDLRNDMLHPCYINRVGRMDGSEQKISREAQPRLRRQLAGAVCVGSLGTACVECLAGIGASGCIDCF